MQDALKLMVRSWLGDPQADEKAAAVKATADGSVLGAAPAGDEFTEARTQAISKESNPVFEASMPTPRTGTSRKARKARNPEGHEAGEPMTAMANPANDPAYQTYLEAPLA